jgi:hypothetical protein
MRASHLFVLVALLQLVCADVARFVYFVFFSPYYFDSFSPLFTYMT